MSDSEWAYKTGNQGGSRPTGMTAAEQTDYERGVSDRKSLIGSFSGGAGSGGGVAILAIPLLPFALILATCAFPVPGLITWVSGWLISRLLGMQGLLLMLVLAIPCLAIFFFSMSLERKLELKAGYRVIRHVLRAVMTGYLVWQVCIIIDAVTRPQTLGVSQHGMALWPVLAGLAAAALGWLASRFVDRRLGDANGLSARIPVIGRWLAR